MLLRGLTHLDLGGEVLHDGADELGLVRGEGGGVAAGGGGFGGVVHGGGDVLFSSCVGVFLLVVVEWYCQCEKQKLFGGEFVSHDCLWLTFASEVKRELKLMDSLGLTDICEELNVDYL